MKIKLFIKNILLVLLLIILGCISLTALNIMGNIVTTIFPIVSIYDFVIDSSILLVATSALVATNRVFVQTFMKVCTNTKNTIVS